MTHAVTKAALIFLGLALFSGKLFYDLYSGATNPLPLNISNDLINYWWPFLSHASETVRSGALPLWNPYTSIGNSVLGEIGAGLFHPTTWTIYIIDDIPTALLVSQLATVIISMLGAYAYSRYLDLHTPATVLCVILFGYSAFTESFSHSAGASSCWFPAILYLTHRCFDRPTVSNASWLALALAMSFFGGFANYFLYTCMIVGVYFCTLLACTWHQRSLADTTKRLSLMALAVILMAGFISIQLLPAYELSSLSVRNLNSTTAFNPDSWWENTSVSLLFLNFLLPNHNFIFGIEALKVDTGLFYLGGALILLPLAYMSERYRITAFALTCGCILILLLILSTQLSALSFIQEIPLIGSLRLHSRGMVYIEFLMICVAALGVSEIEYSGFHVKAAISPITTSVSKLILAAFAIAISVTAVVVVQDVMSIAGVLLCAGLIIYWITSSPDTSRTKQLGWLIVIIVVIDVSVHRQNRFLIPAFSNPDQTFAQASANDYKNRGDHYRLLLVPAGFEETYSLANLGLSLGVPNISAYDSLTLNRWRNFIRELMGPEQFDRIITNSPLEWFYGDLGPHMVKQLLSDGRSLGLASLRYVYTRKNTSVNEYALPRSYTVHNYIEAATEQESLDAVRDNLAMLHESVVLENANITFSSDDYSNEAGVARDKVVIQSYTPNEVELSVSAARPAILVLTDAFYPGWEAYIDGKETEIYRANSVFRAIEVPSGQHWVVFRYHPTSLYLGAAITLMTLVLALLMVYAPRHFRKRNPGHPDRA